MTAPTPLLIDVQDSLLAVIDMQDAFAPTIADWGAITARIAFLLKAAAELQVPVAVSEQYRKGLGPTIAELAQLMPDAQARAVDKTVFACTGSAPWMAQLEETGRKTVVVTGIEAHVCVLQTSLSLKALGYNVFVVADAISARDPASRLLALQRLERHGVEIVDAEMVFFEWLRRSGTPQFKALSPLLKPAA